MDRRILQRAASISTPPSGPTSARKAIPGVVPTGFHPREGGRSDLRSFPCGSGYPQLPGNPQLHRTLCVEPDREGPATLSQPASADAVSVATTNHTDPCLASL